MFRCAYLCLLLILGYLTTESQTPCQNGMAGSYPCQNVDLLTYRAASTFGGGSTNEVWGWTDPQDGKEYVILGKSNGVAFFSIENPVNPVYLGTLPPYNSNSFWRTLRVYNNYLFVGSEASGHGIQVFDLTKLRGVANPPVTFQHDARYNGIGKCHSLAIDEVSGMLYACGTSTFSGGLHIVDISDPLNPVIAGGYSDDGYVHEVEVLHYDGPDTDYTGRTIAICYSGNDPVRMTVADVTDPQDVITISSSSYPSGAYCHQGWFTPDKRYLLLGDELDEPNNLFNKTRTLIWDMLDLDQPVFKGNFLGPTSSVDHNQYIIGNLSFQSNYTAGMRLIDTRNVGNALLKEVGYFDHYTSNNANTFNGEWMNYPYFESGVIPATDIYNGLFFLQVNFLQLAVSSFQVCAGDSYSFSVSINEGFAGPVNFSVEDLPPGVSAVFSSQAVSSPAQVTLTLSGFQNAPSEFSFDIRATGAHFSYLRPVSVTVTPPPLWYADSDGDGWGNANLSLAACSAPPGYASLPGDCNETDPYVHPGAPGSGQGEDNNCNGQIEGLEIPFCADVNGDGIVSVLDIIAFTSWPSCSPCQPDLNQNGMVNTADLMMIIADYGQICE